MDPGLIAIGKTLQVTGDIIIALLVLSVHVHLRVERKIDRAVVRYMRREQWFIYAGIALIIVGYYIEMTATL